MVESNLPLISDLPMAALAGKTVLLRLDLNVPILNGQVGDDFRLEKVLPTIELLRARGARVVMLGHLGDSKATLAPVADYFGRLFPIQFVPNLEELGKAKLSAPIETILCLENLRHDAGEESNDGNFAARLAAVGDIYVNEAFASSHREHASIVGLPRLLPSYAGLLLAEEVRNLSRVFKAEPPFVLILGGAKFKTKLALMKKLIGQVDQIFVYGALAHSFFQEMGYELGQSLVDADHAVARPFLNHPKIVLPVDVRVKNGEKIFIKTPDKLVKEDIILDVGLLSVERLLPAIHGANFVLWNGPIGNFELGFRRSTEAAAKFVADSNATSIIGGGDTVAAIRALDLLNQFDFVSTGGGAMLDFIASGTLPGIEALKNSKI